MKQKIAYHNNNIASSEQEQLRSNIPPPLTEEMSILNIYWFDYSCPFVPMTDLTIVFDALEKLFKKWFSTKRKFNKTKSLHY